MLNTAAFYCVMLSHAACRRQAHLHALARVSGVCAIEERCSTCTSSCTLYSVIRFRIADAGSRETGAARVEGRPEGLLVLLDSGFNCRPMALYGKPSRSPAVCRWRSKRYLPPSKMSPTRRYALVVKSPTVKRRCIPPGGWKLARSRLKVRRTEQLAGAPAAKGPVPSPIALVFVDAVRNNTPVCLGGIPHTRHTSSACFLTYISPAYRGVCPWRMHAHIHLQLSG
jgi:hypothetical protein